MMSNPSLDLNAYLTKSTPFFRKYVEDKMSEVRQECSLRKKKCANFSCARTAALSPTRSLINSHQPQHDMLPH